MLPNAQVLMFLLSQAGRWILCHVKTLKMLDKTFTVDVCVLDRFCCLYTGSNCTSDYQVIRLSSFELRRIDMGACLIHCYELTHLSYSEINLNFSLYHRHFCFWSFVRKCCTHLAETFSYANPSFKTFFTYSVDILYDVSYLFQLHIQPKQWCRLFQSFLELFLNWVHRTWIIIGAGTIAFKSVKPKANIYFLEEDMLSFRSIFKIHYGVFGLSFLCQKVMFN